MISLEVLKRAQETLAGKVNVTPMIYSQTLSSMSGAEVYLKLENLQITGSFKSRGALVRLASLSKEEAAKGVVAASAGNHAQGVAYHAQNMGIPATIVMPKGTPFNKISKTEKLGAKVIVSGETFIQARNAALDLVKSDGLTYVSPYDHEDIMAGQGVVGLEMIDQVEKPLDAILVPIGGGGLLAGVASAFKHLSPNTEIFGVQCDAFPSMADSFYNQNNTKGGYTLAEGIAVKEPGDLTAPIIKETTTDIFVVNEIQIEEAVLSLAENQRLTVEGAGAVGLAALLQNKERFAGKRVGLVLSGGNIDSRILSSVLLRGLYRDGRMAVLRIAVPDQPGHLAKITKIMSDNGANIVEIYHQRMFFDLSVKLTEVDVVVETLDKGHVQRLIEQFVGENYSCREISEKNA
ncbi:MAG: threonine ammonia-lyase [Terasakiella sp.]|uniref:threonine ammonia-lyase n=1 Tax=unclassified Terasakiella TaxID=2614952 RepID=UPI003B006E21